MKNDRRLLKEYIKEVIGQKKILKEDGIGSYDSMGLGMGWGASQQDLMSAFITPFTDVVKTAVGQAKEVVRKGSTLLRVAFETVVTTLLPFVEDSYDEIFKKEKEDIEKIRSEYKDVYDRTDKAFDNDAPLAFFLAPGPYMLSKAASVGPAATKNILSISTGGLSDKLFDKISGIDPFKKGKSEARTLRGKFLNEEKKEVDFKDQLEKVLSDPRVQAALKKNVEPIGEKLKDAKREKLQAAFDMAKNVVTAKSAGQIEKALKGKVSSADIKKKLSSAKDLKDMKPEDLQKVMDQIPKGSMEFMKNMFVAPLEKELKDLESSKADPEIIGMYKQVISKIKAL